MGNPDKKGLGLGRSTDGRMLAGAASTSSDHNLLGVTLADSSYFTQSHCY